ncbi:uncharacterized protein BDZ99DRAFT_476301 [Mytilinidion resinicola]|uniref:DUF7730 domain-containing protein n=1 Tax=Mytilinidion resinicola TaxID=574789 RepID=A0A6A6YMI2_9PEZI|nr:uncharacterized protein BDZ99DRAFT_476301 [Mytilinidion resinicola]KAF2810086.1 hypothetical protein BDZ99DRAFT_476301 [Mytilinidion resinicola]
MASIAWPSPPPTPPPHLPNPRPRALTLPLIQIADIPQHTAAQSSSLLLQRLPLELRQEIWRLVLGGSTIYFCHADGSKFSGHVCDGPGHACFFGGSVRTSGANRAKRLPLLLTCRQIYTEGIDLLYANTTFNIDEGPFFQDTLAELPQLLLPQRLACIRSLNLRRSIQTVRHDVTKTVGFPTSRWETLWEIIASMRQLQHLSVDFFEDDFLHGWGDTAILESEHAPLEELIIAPIEEMPVLLKSFYLSVPWPVTREVEIAGKRWRIQTSNRDWAGF